MSRTPDAVLFDAGGTLVLQDPAQMSRLLGIPIHPDAAFEAHYRTMAEFSDLKRSGDEATWDWFLERFFSKLGHPDPPAAGPAIDRGYLLWNWPIPGVAEALAELTNRGVRTAVVSNSDGSVEESLSRAGFGRFFEFVIDSEVVGSKKPDPRIFHLACERIGLDPADVWYVGDSMHHDIDGARAAGFGRAWLVDPLRIHDVEDRLDGVDELPARIAW